ncbi:MAG: 2-oxoglutarate dehydrogenase E1 component [Chitinophagales bacterium]|nr:2-oxoglutarate dehydrogenase E1 component [Chitinophagales bacterium]
MDNFTYISNAHPDYIEALYKDFQKDPTTVDPEFKKFFEGFEFASKNYSEDGDSSAGIDELKVFHLIQAYRNKGHLLSDTNPIRPRKDRGANLDIEHFGLDKKDLDKEYYAGNEINIGKATLREIVDHLEKCYTKSIGFEYNYVRIPEELTWLRQKIENNPAFKDYAIEKREEILRSLNKAVVFEKFLGTKYVGEKRFSLEGGETTIPALEAIIATSAKHGVEEVIVGMAHRGRLNVLANILGKTYEEIFSEFEGNIPSETMGDGDVKYHLGFIAQYPVGDRDIYIKLTPNPSHLEAVDPIVQGYTRAKADLIYNSDFDKVLPLLIHGDAAIAGQGVVYEVLQMSKLEGYYTGGTVHFVINNQIGFTTDFDDARSSDYCTSIAATVHAPVIHVNGDDIEAVIYAAEMAAEYRHQFNKDIFIDMVCYRKHGHNEGDDPKYTQPNLYSLIGTHPNPRDIYSKKLHETGAIEAKLADKMDEEFWAELQDRLDAVKQKAHPYKLQPPQIAWEKLRIATSADFDDNPDTSIGKKMALQIVAEINKLPSDFTPIRKAQKYLESRKKLMEEDGKIDWAGGELMAYASILLEGKDVRISGQDVKRGTFSHRHAVVYDKNTSAEYSRLNHLSDKQGIFRIYNSHLSEYGVLGFEFGYALASPDPLVIWEAQFGDFSNNAQVIIDQFIASAETKWQRNTGLVLLLPHGYEGQGPEHSSARLERFLVTCAELNMIVANVTDPANYFHLLRRQLAWPFRKPLIVMSPKSLLRHPKVVSSIDDITSGKFQPLIDDKSVKDAKKVKRILFCSGKIYFDLIEKKENDKRDDIAVVRLEQLYPLPLQMLEKTINKYKGAEYFWVQEEPLNMGAWSFILRKFYKKYDLTPVGRDTASSPATGFKKQHLEEQQEILNKAFDK